MASANRLIDWRHFCRRSNKMAEMSVPAWPMPIHQTKLTIANPHPTGILIPQTPTPMVSKYAVPNSKTKTRMKESPNPTYQNRGVPCADRTMFPFPVYLRHIDALHTVVAFFHDAAAPHRDVRVSQRLEARGFKIRVLEKVEPAHFVRAIVGTIAGADAAVVNHVVQP